MADGAGGLAVTSQSSGSEDIAGSTVGAALQQCLGDAGAAEDALQGTHVLVLAGMRGTHDGQFGRGQGQVVGSPRFDESDDAERLHRRAQHHLRARRADRADDLAARIELHDMTTMAALDGVTAVDLDQHRRWCALAGPGGAFAMGGDRLAGGPIDRERRDGGMLWHEADGIARGAGRCCASLIGGAGRNRRRAPPKNAVGLRISTRHPVVPSEAFVPDQPNLFISSHPAVLHKLALLRDEATEPKKFRELVREISWLVGYEALADARLDEIKVQTPLEVTTGHELAERLGLVPILRAGLGMVDAFLELFPTAQVWHLGLFRDERTLRPVEYYNKLPDRTTVDTCLILDPMLATGGSATAAIEVLKEWGATRIKLVNLIAAPEGVAAVADAHPDVPIYCAALDRQLNEKGYIEPGLGDAGDRQFGTGL